MSPYYKLVPKRAPLMVKRNGYETREDVSAGMDWDVVGRLYNLGLLWNKMACILQILPTHAHVNALLWHLPQPGGKQVSHGVEVAWNWSFRSFPQIYLRFGIVVCFLKTTYSYFQYIRSILRYKKVVLSLDCSSPLLSEYFWLIYIDHLYNTLSIL